MSEWTRCSRCVQSAAFPGIAFDGDGVCNFCRQERGTVTDDQVIEKARDTVASLIEQLPRRGSYDAILCYSGGKDSTYVLDLATRQYGLRVLAFTLDNGFLSKQAFANIQRVVDKLNVDLITVRPAKQTYKDIIRTSMLEEVYAPRTLTRISAGCNSCISMVNTTALRMALEKRIPLILAGFTLGQIPANAIVYKNNYRFLQESRQASLDKLRATVGSAIDDYYSLDDALVDGIDAYPTTVNLLCLEDITEDDIVEQVQRIGWRSPGDVDGCSSNCRLNTFNNYVHQKRFGYNPYELELSHLIRRGLMTRDEALMKIDDQPEPQRRAIQKELGIGSSDIKRMARAQ